MDTEKEQEQDKTVDGDGAKMDSLQHENEVLADEVRIANAALAELEEVLKAKESEVDNLKKERDGLKQALEGMTKAMTEAVAAYKEVVLQAKPGLPAELITGDTIEAVKESVKNAHAIMEKVRQEMEAEAARTRVPAGAPPRAPADLSGLTAREKIQYAINNK
jgi:hypothetical protein